MGSYNRLNGVYACQHPGIFRTLKQDWDWEGFVAPDFLHAVRDPVAAANAGLDIPGLGVPEGRTAEQVTSGAIPRACGWPPTGGPSLDGIAALAGAGVRVAFAQGRGPGHDPLGVVAGGGAPLHRPGRRDHPAGDRRPAGRGRGAGVRPGVRRPAPPAQRHGRLAAPAAAAQPPRQLKGFAKVRLDPAAAADVTLRLDPGDLAADDEASGSWVVHPGRYELLVGRSSRDLRARATFELAASRGRPAIP